MQYDVVIIGGGLAGLSCAIRLAEQGKQCAIVSAGQSALYFSSGSLDLLSTLPDGTPVSSPLEGFDALAQQAPQHPYSIMGKGSVQTLATDAQGLFARAGFSLKGDLTENHCRITPMGTRCRTWLTAQDVPITAINGDLPWKNVALIGIEGFLDVHPQMVAHALKKEQNIESEVNYLKLPALDRLRGNPSEFRAANIARILDLPENIDLLAEELNRLSANCEAILMPACVGLDSDIPMIKLRELVNKPICLLPTMPPSLLGMRMHHALRRRFQQLGGVVMPGDRVLGAKFDGNKITGLFTRNHEEFPVQAKAFVLASGSFFSNGLEAKFDKIIEPALNLDVVSLENRADWSEEKLFDSHAYLQFGVKTDHQFHVMKEGCIIENMSAIGAVLSGYDPLQQGCGAGVSLTTALYVADNIVTALEGK